MAKKLGADEAPKIPSGKGKTKPEDNKVVTEASFLEAVKEITAQQAVIDTEKRVLKGIREKHKFAGIKLGVLDAKVKMVDWSRGEIRDQVDVERQYATWLGHPIDGRNPTAFAGLSDDEIQRREWAALGKTFSRSGRPGRPPDECPPEFHQAFMRGFNEEDEAAWADADAGGELPAADDAPAPVVAQDYSQPSWSQFSPDPEEWFAAQKTEFRTWFDSLPAQAVVRISHKGVLAAFRAARDDETKEEGAIVQERVDDAPRLEGEAWPPTEELIDPAKVKPAKAKPANKSVH